MSEKIKSDLEKFFKKGGISLKLNIYVRHYFFKQVGNKKIIHGCMYFEFYIAGLLYKIGCMAELELSEDLKEILSIKRTDLPFLEDKSIIILSNKDLNYLSDKYVVPIFSQLIDSNDIPYFKERVYETIDQDFLFDFEWRTIYIVFFSLKKILI